MLLDPSYNPLRPANTTGNAPMHPLRAVAEAALAEYDRAKAKHGDQTPDGACLPNVRLRAFATAPAPDNLGQSLIGAVLLSADLRRLATLTEELGEVGRCLTYDQDHAGELRKELIQVAAMALAWASRLESV
jgi:hypothetical protein